MSSSHRQMWKISKQMWKISKGVHVILDEVVSIVAYEGSKDLPTLNEPHVLVTTTRGQISFNFVTFQKATEWADRKAEEYQSLVLIEEDEDEEDEDEEDEDEEDEDEEEDDDNDKEDEEEDGWKEDDDNDNDKEDKEE